ncbi:hypothetical protein IPdc08_01148 [archaeon]|nr:hypothetical protein IPdc08_01148 [archaeon]
MNRSAQVTLEFIVIIGIFMIIFTGITLPMAFKVSSASKDNAIILEMKNNLNNIASGVEVVGSQGYGSTRTVEITSDISNWGISAYPDYLNRTIVYYVNFSSNVGIPTDIETNITGIGALGTDVGWVEENNGTLTNSFYNFNGNGKGTWKVRIENMNSGYTKGVIRIGNTLIGGDTINMTILPQ